jgi:hypothetical protein
MSPQHPVLIEDKQKSPTKPKPDTMQRSPAQEGAGREKSKEARRLAAGARQLGPV